MQPDTIHTAFRNPGGSSTLGMGGRAEMNKAIPRLPSGVERIAPAT